MSCGVHIEPIYRIRSTEGNWFFRGWLEIANHSPFWVVPFFMLWDRFFINPWFVVLLGIHGI